MKVSELAGQFATMSAQLDKVQAEILAKIAELEAALTNVDVPAEAEAALNEIKAKVQGMDDIVPDQPVP